MAPTEANAHNAYRLSVKRLITACEDLEGDLPPFNPDEEGERLFLPSIYPRPKNIACNDCATELEALDAAGQAEHVCTHQQLDETGGQNVIGGVDTGARTKVPRLMQRRRQPNSGVIRQDISKLDEKYDTFTVNLSTLATVLDKTEAEGLEEHFLIWGQYCRWLKDRAYCTIDILEAQVANLQKDTVTSEQAETRSGAGNIMDNDGNNMVVQLRLLRLLRPLLT